MQSRLLAYAHVLALGASLAGCDAVTTPQGHGTGVHVAVFPESAQVFPAGSVGFSATLSGTADTSVVWSVSEAGGGTVDANGLYTAPGAFGQYHVVAASAATPSATAVAVVTVTPSPVIAVAIWPPVASAAPGGTAAFTVSVTGTLPGQSSAVTWTVHEPGGGSVTSGGLYTAPETTGTYHVVATSVADPSKSAIATVNVTSPTGRPAPAPRTGTPNLVTFTATNGGSGTISVSGLGTAVVWFDAPFGSGFDLKAAPVNVGWSRGVPTAYVIEASSDSGASWTTLVTSATNTYTTWAHAVDLTGRNRVRMRLTADPVGGSAAIDFGVHDARGGLDDFWLFLGDSNTHAIFVGNPPGDLGRFGYNVHGRDPGRWPIAINGGVSAGVIPQYLRTRDEPWSGSDGTGPLLYPDGQGNPQPLFRKWMQQFPGKYVSIAIGTNDVNGFSWRPATAADLDAMQARYELLIGEALAAGKTVVLPTLRWCTTNGYTAANLAAWNQRLWNVILPRYPTAIRGPDVYANSENHPEWLSDGTHPNELGRAATRQVWLDWAMANIYSAP